MTAIARLSAAFSPSSLFHRNAPPEPQDSTRARRAFVHEMLDRNPQAFASDLDVQAMMAHFPDRF